MPPPNDRDTERLQLLEAFDPNNPSVQILLLAQRVDNLTKEKEALEETARQTERRLAKIEASFGKGAGILIGLSVVGTLAGGLLVWGKTLFAPWMTK